MKIRSVTLCIALIVGLSGFSAQTAGLVEEVANGFFEKIVEQLSQVDNVREFSEELTFCNKSTVLVQGGATVVLGVSGFLTGVSLLITLKKIFSEKKEREWKGTKITTGVIATILFGLISGGSYFGGQVAGLLNDWTSSKLSFGKKCAELGLQTLVKRFIL